MSINRGDERRLTVRILEGDTPTDPDALTLTIRDPAGNISTLSWQTDPDIVRVSTGVFFYVPVFDSAGDWTYQWQSSLPPQVEGETLVVAPAPLDPQPATFATVVDIAARVGRDLTAGETTQVPVLLELATSLIAEAAGKDSDWPATVSPIPPGIRSVCIEATVRVLHNPSGVRSQQEALGVYSHQENYIDAIAGLGLALTDAEITRVRRAAFGKLTATSKPKSIASHLFRDITGSVVVDDLDTNNQ